MVWPNKSDCNFRNLKYMNIYVGTIQFVKCFVCVYSVKLVFSRRRLPCMLLPPVLLYFRVEAIPLVFLFVIFISLRYPFRDLNTFGTNETKNTSCTPSARNVLKRKL